MKAITATTALECSKMVGVGSLEGSVPIIKDGYAVAVSLLAGTIFLSMVFLPGALTHTVGLGREVVFSD